MRLGILGPAQGDLRALAQGARLLLDEGRADRVLYLSDDDALDHVVHTWARGLVGPNPSESALFARAAGCAGADPEAIDAFVASEQARVRLRALASLPRGRRTIELLDSRVVLFVFDKATLDEEDIIAATVLVFGKGTAPLIKKVGPRTFLSPGPLGTEEGGAAILDDGGGGLRIEILNVRGVVTARETLGGLVHSAKMRVQGGSGG